VSLVALNSLGSVLAETFADKSWIKHTRQHLAVEGEPTLANLLRVADVEVRSLLEVEIALTPPELIGDLLSSDRDSATYGILGISDVVANIVEHFLVGPDRSLEHK